jgi:ATP-dependent protease ClpP protease subunit
MDFFKKPKAKKRKLGAFASAYNNNNEDSEDEGGNGSGANGGDNNIYVSYNHIYFTGDITKKSAFNLCKNIRLLESELRIEEVEKNICNEMFLHITTDGGCISSAFSIIDCMESSRIPVNTVIDGSVSSAGTLISIHGKKRFVCKNSYVLIHELRSGCWGKLAYIDDTYKNCIKIQEHINRFYLTKTKINKKMLKDLLIKDLQFNADECINMGVADSIYMS